ncbi:hypothetical protein SNE26_25695 [Mucilaginibacter sp. cycad4]|uniref:hypothetical protein n=1 Tax=Mucilaginibacter sp. cycad4 TaxID=3342096 RepID=UPI002AABAA94|nr:hypothetical protein [Mucilaginibacter gossypii]WPU99412.1 hypothetical protein SNE26_25695 [Mucilaginibacter gossypii]
MDICFIPECFVDTNLLETLVPPQKQYNHQKGCGTVTKVMKEKFKDDFSVGLIDKDKKQVDYLKEFDLVIDRDPIFLHKHKNRPHYIIQISPAIEQFILNEATDVGIDIAHYDLPSELLKLTKISKSTTSKNDQRFKRLFTDLIQNQASNLIVLRKWIKYLKSETYKVNIDAMKKL